MVCTQCGVVVEGHMIDSAPEWRSHDVHDRSRAGASENLLLPDQHHRTTFDASRTNGRAAECTSLWRCVGRDPLASLRDAFAAIDGYVRGLGLSTEGTAAAWAKEVYRDMNEAKPVRGAEARQAHAAAAVYFGCKLAGAARELRHISASCGVGIAALNDAVAGFKDRLGGKSYHPRLFEAVQAGTLINMYADRLGLGDDDLRRTKRAAHVLDEQLLHVLDCGRAPRTICSGVLWLAAAQEGVRVSKRAVMAACGVCQQTIDKVTAQISQVLEDHRSGAAPALPAAT
jgi:transcription initiation factor TFIIIB Brf1 subunit/transcription initiation factor TFIIB